MDIQRRGDGGSGYSDMGYHGSASSRHVDTSGGMVLLNVGGLKIRMDLS